MAQAACDRQRRSETLPLRILPLSRFPALSKTPRTQTSPGSQVPGRRKLVHVQSDLRQQSPGGHPVHSGNGAQPNDLIPKRAHAPIDLLLDLTPFRFREAQVLEELSEQKSMMPGHTTFERQLQFRDLVPQQSFGHLGQPGSVLLPGEHRLQDRSPRSTPSIGRYRCQLNVGILQHLLNAIRNAVDLLYQTHAIPREVAKFACWLRGHETPSQQSVLQQVRDPLAVFLVRLPTGHSFNVLRIHQQHLELLRKNVPHRLPVHASRLHGHMGYATRLAATLLQLEPIFILRCGPLGTMTYSYENTFRRSPTKIPSGDLSEWLQGHFVAQAFQPPDQGSADAVHVDPVKVVRTEFPVVFLTLQHVIGNLQQRVCYRHDRALSSPPSSNAPIQRREVVVLHHRDGPGRLRQTTSERDIALAHLATQPFPGA